MTLSRYFLKLQADSGMSLREISRRAKVDATTPWKVCHDRPVRAKTLGMLLRAMGLTERDEAYVKAFALWSTEQSETLSEHRLGQGIEESKKGTGQEFSTAMNRVSKAFARIPERDWPVIIEAIENPEALKLWVQSTRALVR